MDKKTSNFGLLLSTLLFIIFIVLALVFKSIDYLYIASVCPLLIVPFLPDIRSVQYLRDDKADSPVRLIKLQDKQAAESDLLVILFEPGTVKWKRDRLFICLDDAITSSTLRKDEFAATLSVLKYDLCLHPRKRGWVGISLQNLVQRTSQLSYTTQEINRLVISMADLNELLNAKRPNKQAPSAGRSLQA